MEARRRSWWQKIKQHRVTILVVAIILVVVIALIIIGYRFDWTGFNGKNKSGKTLWDWMQLLFIPVVLAIAGFWFNHRERRAAELRADNDRKAAALRAEAGREIEQKRSEAERGIAEDNQREAALQAYINELSELLLHENLRESVKGNEVRNIARVRTLTVLTRLDPDRKGSLLLFLHESGLIKNGKCIIDLNQANLREANLEIAILDDADLRGVDLKGASMGYSFFVGANLSYSDLAGVDLSGVDLTGANLELSTGVNVEQLEKQAESLKGATMPDGSIHP